MTTKRTALRIQIRQERRQLPKVETDFNKDLNLLENEIANLSRQASERNIEEIHEMDRLQERLDNLLSRLDILEFGQPDFPHCDYPLIRKIKNAPLCHFQSKKHFRNLINKICPDFYLCKSHAKVFVASNYTLFQLGILKEVLPSGKLRTVK